MDDYGTQIEGPRTLTEADVQAIAVALEKRLENKFYRDLGRGFWGLVWKVAIGFLVFVAAQGVHDKFWRS